MFTVQALTSVVNQLLPEPHAGLLNGILFGTKAMLSKELYQALVTTGTLHIVALSGMNITILINLVHLLFLGFISRRLSSLLTMGVITGFVWFVGPSASVVRAAIMGGIGLLAVVFGRQTWAILSWLLAVSTMLLLNFSWLTDLSFQLSALATLGIILFGKGSAAEVGNEWGAYRGSFFTAHPSSAGNLRVTRGGGPPRRGPHMSGVLGGKPAAGPAGSSLRVTVLENTRRAAPLTPLSAVFVRLWQLIKDDLRLTLSAQVFTIPLIFFYFHRVSLISPLTNLLIGWVLPPLTATGILMALGGYIFLPLGQVIAWVVWVPLEYLIRIVELTSKIPGASLKW